MPHFHPVHLVVGGIDIHLGGVWEFKLEVEGIVLCISLVKCCVTGEECVQVVKNKDTWTDAKIVS